MSLELTPAAKEFSFNSLVRAFEGDSVGMSNGMSFWIRGQQDAPSLHFNSKLGRQHTSAPLETAIIYELTVTHHSP